jgi:TATA-box binding protein (TBP) (component of TFIID and TFIIIB)
MSLDAEWEQFIAKQSISCIDSDSSDSENEIDNIPFEDNLDPALIVPSLPPSEPPKCSDMYISTKSKIIFLNQPVDLKSVFWGIPITPYGIPSNGIIKKQMKFNSLSIEEFNEVQMHVEKCDFVDQHVIRSINNPDGRIKFKDIRKVSVGLCKKDLLSYRCKKKSAFYNCFVLILRLFSQQLNEFKEHHVKIFNTGKVGVVGVQTPESFYEVLDHVVDILKPFFKEPLIYKKETSSTILINSNFSTGFLINREAFYDLLKYKYKIDTIYDPCSYPGIQCKYKFRDGVIRDESILSQQIRSSTLVDKKEKEQTKVSFMIFRTGSVLIVGKCDEAVLTIVYEFLKTVIQNDYSQIFQGHYLNLPEKEEKKIKQKLTMITTSSACASLSHQENL